MNKPPFKLFKYPSRGRPERFFKSLNSIYDNIVDRDFFHVSCTLDLDDPLMCNEDVVSKINDYPNISISWGTSESKIHAVNRDMPDIDWDICFCMSDDMLFNIYGFDQMVGVDMLNWFPNLDGLLHYPDQDAKEYLATMYIAGRKFYERFGFIYDPQFKSLWCDNLVQDAAQRMGKYKFTGYRINLHLNPAYGHLSKDRMFDEQQAHWNHDEAVYRKIIADGLDKYLFKFGWHEK